MDETQYGQYIKATKDIVVVEIAGGPEDMSADAKKYCAAFGKAVGLAQEAIAHAEERR